MNFTGVTESGIITEPKDVGLDGLPDAVFDMPELENSAGLGENCNDKSRRSTLETAIAITL